MVRNRRKERTSETSRETVFGFQVTPKRQEFGQIQRLNLAQGPRFPRTQKIQKDREFPATLLKGRRPKLKSILTVLFVVLKHLLCGRTKMDLFDVGAGTSDAAVLSKVRKHLYSNHDMPPPFLARLIHHFIPNRILLHKASCQIPGKLNSQFLLAGKLDEVFPYCSIPIQRSPAVP